MNKKMLLTGIAVAILLSAVVTAQAQSFSKIYNGELPVYGFEDVSHGKILKPADFTLSDNFISAGNRRVTCETAVVSRDGDELVLRLLLHTGSRQTARLLVKFKSDTASGKNRLTYLSFYDFSTKKTETIMYIVRAQVLERIQTRYAELIPLFYDTGKLFS